MPKPNVKEQLELAERALQLAVTTYVEYRRTLPEADREEIKTIVNHIDSAICNSIRVRNKL